MRVAVVGAAGAVGGAIVDALQQDAHKRVDAVVGIASRLPRHAPADVEWVQWPGLSTSGADLADLETHLRGADALVQVTGVRTGARLPARSAGGARDAVTSARRVLEAAIGAGVVHLVQLSSFLAYSPARSLGAPGAAVGETWPTDGLTSSAMSQRAAALERALNEVTADHEIARVVRLRPGVVLGPRVRQELLARTGSFAGLLRLLEHVPVIPGLEDAGVPVVHHDDLAGAVTAAVTGRASGAYNIALDEPLRLSHVSAVLGARPLHVPEDLARRGAVLADAVAGRVPTGKRSGRSGMAGSAPGGARGPASAWLDVLAESTRLDTRRARDALAWTPRHSQDEALRSTLVTR